MCRRTTLAATLLAAVTLLVGCAPEVAGGGGTAADAPKLTGDTAIMTDGARLPVQHWPAETAADETPSAVLLGVHGFNDYGRAFNQPAQWFAARGVSVYAYDQRGFGGAPHAGFWAGERAMSRDLGAMVRLVRDRHPATPIYLVGVSMGGATVLAAADFDLLPEVAGVVLAAPAVWGRETMAWPQRAALWVGAHTVPWLTLSGAGLDRQPSDNAAALRVLGLDPYVVKETRVDAIHGLVNIMDTALKATAAMPTPALLLYGANDDIVPPEPTRTFWDRVQGRTGVRTALYDAGYHMLLRDRQALTVWRDIAAWIADPDAPLPSGADVDARARLAELPDS